MIKVLIIEDEVAASKRLQKMIAELMPDAAIIDIIVSIAAAINWFRNNKQPDLVFADIHPLYREKLIRFAMHRAGGWDLFH